MQNSRFHFPKPELPGKYRRAFNWRFNCNGEGDDQRAHNQISALLNLGQSESMAVLEDYLYLSRLRKDNRTAMLRLMSHLIGEHYSSERTIFELKETLKKHKEEIASPTGPGHINQIGIRIQEERLYINALRVIGDGIAWRAMDYDRIAMQELSGSRGNQTLVSEGLAEELREWVRHFDAGNGLAIPNVLTNWLTVGDVTVVRPDGSAELIECKSGKSKSSRYIRQKRTMENAVSILTTGQGKEGEREYQILMLEDLTFSTQLGFLGRMLEKIDRCGTDSKAINDFYFVDCWGGRHNPREQQKKMVEEREKRFSQWLKPGDRTLALDSRLFLTFDPRLAPFSIFPFSASTCIDLIVGVKAYRVEANLSAIEREFKRDGWEVFGPQEVASFRRESPDHPVGRAEGWIVVGKGGRSTTGINFSMLTQMLMELRDPRVLIEALNRMTMMFPIGSRNNFVQWKLNESGVWR